MHTLGRRGGPSVSSLPPIPPLVPDGGFEIPVVGGGNFVVSPIGSPWTWTSGGGGQAGIAGNNSAFGPPSIAPEGVQVAFLQSISSVAQSLYFPRAGRYKVSFQAAERVSTGGGTKTVSIDGTTIATVTGIGTSYVNITTAAFVVSVGQHVLMIAGNDVADKTMLFDAITIILG